MKNLLFFLVCQVEIFSTVFASERYNVVDLGTFGGPTSTAYALNDRRQVVGYADTSDGEQHAFLYSGGTRYDIGAWGKGWSSAFAINERGDVAGYIQYINNNSFLYSDGVLKLLGWNTGAYGINSLRHVVGDIPGAEVAFYANNGWTGLGVIGYPLGINDKDQVVGGMYSGHAFLYDDGVIRELGVIGTETTRGDRGWSINSIGQIVGNSGGYGFLYQDGIMHELFPGVAQGINEKGKIVGATGNSNAVLYVDGLITDLNTLIDPLSGWNLLGATDINNNDEIVGYGLNPFGQLHGFLLTLEDLETLPVIGSLPDDPLLPGSVPDSPFPLPHPGPPPPPSAVPEPSTWLGTICLIGITLLSKRYKLRS